MTINLVISSGVRSPVLTGLDGVEKALFDLTVISSSATKAVLLGTCCRAVVKGENFGYTDVGVISFLSSGRISSIDVDTFGADALDFTGLSLRASKLFKLSLAERLGNTDAIEKYLFGQDWTITSNDRQDILTRASKAGDGVKINLRGDDTIDLRGGDDRFFAGNGNDLVKAGKGNDTVWGGKDNDVLRGGSGRDKLFGEAGNDRLFGEWGADALVGGIGRDLLVGGKGDDRLKGGAGADIFKFTGDAMGADHIVDFEDGVDRIDLDYARVDTIKTKRDGVLVEYDGGSIYIDDIIISAVTEADFI